MGWQVTEEGQNAFGHVSSKADGFGDIATTWGPDAAANARLIAAAPDLLSALEEIVGAVPMVLRAEGILSLAEAAIHLAKHGAASTNEEA